MRLGVVYYWTDPRVADWPEDEDLPAKLWCPKMLCVNREESFVVAPDGLNLIDAANGRLKRGYNLDGLVTNPLEDMEMFPFDLDTLDIRLYTESNWETPDAATCGMHPKKRQYRLLPVVPGTGEGDFWWFGWDGSIEEWTMHGHSYFIEEHAPTASGALGTSIHLKFHLSRQPGFYISKVVVPLIMLWQMQFWTFAFENNRLEDKISHISTLLLTTCAVVYVISAFLPKLAFLTMIDRRVRRSSPSPPALSARLFSDALERDAPSPAAASRALARSHTRAYTRSLSHMCDDRPLYPEPSKCFS